MTHSPTFQCYRLVGQGLIESIARSGLALPILSHRAQAHLCPDDSTRNTCTGSSSLPNHTHVFSQHKSHINLKRGYSYESVDRSFPIHIMPPKRKAPPAIADETNLRRSTRRKPSASVDAPAKATATTTKTAKNEAPAAVPAVTKSPSSGRRSSVKMDDNTKEKAGRTVLCSHLTYQSIDTYVLYLLTPNFTGYTG